MRACHLLCLAALAPMMQPPAARAGEDLISKTLSAFTLGQRDHDALFGPGHWKTLRRQLDEAIETLRK